MKLLLTVLLVLTYISVVSGTQCVLNTDCPSRCCMISRNCQILGFVRELCEANKTDINPDTFAHHIGMSDRYIYACPCRGDLRCGIYTMLHTGYCEVK